MIVKMSHIDSEYILGDWNNQFLTLLLAATFPWNQMEVFMLHQCEDRINLGTTMGSPEKQLALPR